MLSFFSPLSQSVQYGAGEEYYCGDCARVEEKKKREKQDRFQLHRLTIKAKTQPWVTDISMCELASNLSSVLYALRSHFQSLSEFPEEMSHLMIPPNLRQIQLDALFSDYLVTRKQV